MKTSWPTYSSLSGQGVSLKAFAYFIRSDSGRPGREARSASDDDLEHKAKSLLPYFTLPFAAPVLASAKDFKV